MHYYCNTSLVTIKWVCKKESGHQGLHTFKGPIMLRPTANYTDSDLLPKRTRQWWIMRMMKRWREENRQHIKVRKSWGWKIWAYFPPPQRYNSSWWLFDLSKPLSFLCCKESWCRVVTATWHPVTSLRSLRGAPALYVSHLWACRADGGTTVAVLSAASVCLLPLHFPATAVGSVMVMVFFFFVFLFFAWPLQAGFGQMVGWKWVCVQSLYHSTGDSIVMPFHSSFTNWPISHIHLYSPVFTRV